jgi:hypothetical protein
MAWVLRTYDSTSEELVAEREVPGDLGTFTSIIGYMPSQYGSNHLTSRQLMSLKTAVPVDLALGPHHGRDYFLDYDAEAAVESRVRAWNNHSLVAGGVVRRVMKSLPRFVSR